METLLAPTPRARFQFWGGKAALALPAGVPPVVFEYLTEPPHGDPQYKITISGVAVGGGSNPIGFFGRDLHLSSCSRFLAATSIARSDCTFHVIDLVDSKYWSREGFVQLISVSTDSLVYRPYPRGDLDTPGQAEERADLRVDANWIDIWVRWRAESKI